MNEVSFLEQAMNTARLAAVQGAQTALRFFRSGVSPEWKDDRSPVTEADREAEAVIVATIQAQFPQHGILAEESGFLPGDQEYRWIIDPIDGTRGFIRAGKFWGSLVALEYRGQVVAGAMALPALELEYWAGRGLGCFRNGIRVQVSQESRWEDATLSLGELQHLLSPPYQSAITGLIQTAASTRCYGDPGGLMMVLDGLADVWMEAGVKPWDLAAASVLIEEAGGRFSNFRGTHDLNDGTAIASNGLLHEEILNRLRLMS
jgi:histidinol-phosphatase